MKLSIRFEASYRYDAPVSFSPHLFKLFPRPERFLKVLSTDFQTNAGSDVQIRRDLFGNEFARVWFPEKGQELTATLRLELEVTEHNAFHFLLERRALDLPLQYTPHERAVLAPFLVSPEPLELPFWKRPAEPAPTVETLVALNEALHTNLGYEVREEGGPRPSAETLALGRGSCRDFMVLHADVLRTMGVATRLVSGYVCEFESAEKRAEGALHAWTEAYLPGAGWLGFDPTNGVLCDHNHIAAAVGLTDEDIAPTTGSYYSDTPVKSTMEARLHLAQTP